MSEKRRILLTNALPYANGYIHLGHLVGYIQADIWMRFQRMQGHEAIHICGDDTHGTPIMMRARELGKTPEQVIGEAFREHFADFKDFHIEFSHYSSTHTEENRLLCEEFYSHMKNHTARKNIRQLFCEHDKIFLPDRFVKGACPKCGALDQYGDSCDVCGATYSPEDLRSPTCSICGTPPIKKDSEHILFKLNDFKSYLQDWLPKHCSAEITNKMLEWFNEDLREWDISRDGPYFGFQIPGETNKYFYVWVDAPMGYVSATKQWCQKNGREFNDFWRSEKYELYHVIGKDIVYFHTLFWPALLKCAGFRSPTNVFVHGRLMFNGEKMSKSKGTMVPARSYLSHLDPEHLRYYYFTKLGPNADDFDLNLTDFQNRVNSDLVGKITNLGSRSAQMLLKSFQGQTCALDPVAADLLRQCQNAGDEIAAFYNAREFTKAANAIRELADLGNKYFDTQAPWKIVEHNPQGAQQALSLALQIFRVLTIYLKPVVPEFAKKVETLFSEKPYSWEDSKRTQAQIKIQNFSHLLKRIEKESITKMMDDSAKANAEIQVQRQNAKSTAPEATKAETSPSISIDDFMKVDLRIGKIVSAEAIPEADKLLRLQIDLGEEKPRQVFAGIKAAYTPEKLVGRHTIVVANLAPRKMKFGMSEGMVLAAGEGGSDLYILSPDTGAKPGQRVK